jgi:hypothetical protein
MESLNVEYLKNSLKYLGFGTALNSALESKLAEKQENFSLGVSSQFDAITKGGKVVNDRVNYELNFSKSTQTDNYFLNSYKVTVENSSNKIENTFLLGKGNDVTAKEAYNLLKGASILKKAEIQTTYDLIQSNGEQQKPLGAFKSTAEISNFIQSLPKEEKGKTVSFEARDKDFLIREFSNLGEAMPINSKNIELVFSYKDQNSNEKFNAIYNVSNYSTSLDKINQIVDKPLPNSLPISFEIRDKTNAKPLAQFDNSGKELPLVAPKKLENIWIKLDFDNKNERGDISFKKFYQNYGFDLESELSKFPIKQLSQEPEKSRLLASLGRGNTQKANLMDGQSVYIQPDPQFKKINFYDLNFSSLSVSQNANIQTSTKDSSKAPDIEESDTRKMKI